MHAFMIEALRLAVWFVLLSAIFVPLERIVAVHPQRIFRRQFGVDLIYYALNSVLVGVLLAVPLAILAAALHRVMPAIVTHTIAALPFGVKLVLALLVAETGFYWGHRWSHEVPLLWRFHSIHHSTAELDYLSNTRAHPVDMVFTRMCGFMPLFALGLTQGVATPAVVIVIGTIWGFFIHANLRWRFGFLESIVATPFFHHWHHTNDPMRDRNYAAMLPVVDRVFGTLHLPKAWPTEYGIDGAMPSSIVGQVLHPFTMRDDVVAVVENTERHRLR
ncbi:sterol desaturase family protein [Acidiphilium sp.]|uniref:sterol desaturase family protein n=1 Tax=Acidiphilium sp. TaxID=527 RepID=UPI003D0459E4